MKKLSILLLTINLLGAKLSMQAMDQPDRLINWQKVKTQLSTSLPAQYCTLLFAGLKNFDINDLTRELTEVKLEDASVQTKEFIRSTLKKYGVTQDIADAIKIKKGDRWAIKTSILDPLNSHLSAPEEFVNMVLTPDNFVRRLLFGPRYFSLSVPSDPSISPIRMTQEEWLKSSEATILHEYGHMHNKDIIKTYVAVSTAFFSTYYLTAPLVQNLSNYLSTQSRVTKASLSILRASIAGITALFWFMAYRKYQEYNADMFAIQLIKDPEVLESQGKFFKLVHDNLDLPKISSSEYEDRYKRDKAFRELYYFWQHAKDDHPSNLTRSEYFLTAAEALRSQQLKNKNE
ncbi:MAG TPA: M48 family metalloprotease [Candidatus Babeliales bacterium]|nr:M48 family metalloprotease [Candidatus Babeliales bacterium]